MADNTQISNASGGTETIADDDIADGGVANGAKVQRVKNGFGADGSYTDVDATHPLPVAQQGTATVAVSGTPNVAVTNTPAVTVSGTVTVDTELPAASALSDSQSNPTTALVGAPKMVWNGSSWDRARGANSASATAGVGIPAAGLMGFDAPNSNWRRVLIETSGAVNVCPQYYENQWFFNAVGTGGSWDARGYSRFSVQIAGTWTGQIKFQYSNDGTTYYDYVTYSPSATGAAVPNAVTITANGMYFGVIAGKYIRANATSWSSGSANLFANLFATSGEPYMAVDTEIAAASALADTSTNPTTGMVGANALIYNGSSWDRARSFGALGALGVTPTPGTTGGWTSSNISSVTTALSVVKGSQGTFGGYYLYNSNAGMAYLQVFNAASTGAVTLGTTTPIQVYGIPPSSAANVEFTNGVQHAAGIVIATTTTPTGATAPGSQLHGHLLYK